MKETEDGEREEKLFECVGERETISWYICARPQLSKESRKSFQFAERAFCAFIAFSR